VLVVRRLDHPGQVHDRIGAAQNRLQRVARDVGGDPGGLRRRDRRLAPGDADDGLDLGLVGQRLEQRRADVAGGPGDRDPHVRSMRRGRRDQTSGRHVRRGGPGGRR
jgi:hypothetical protein